MRILHVLSQRPGLSGSGVFFNALLREGARRAFSQHAVVMGPAGTGPQDVPSVTLDSLTVIEFPSPKAPFPVPGNSDVMPYPSTVFSQMTSVQIGQYVDAIRDAFERIRREFLPQIVHTHHLWLASALAREIFLDIPVVATAHNSELRQLIKAKSLAPKVLPGIRALDGIGVLTPRSRKDTISAFGVDESKIRVTGAGFRRDLFHFPSLAREEIAQKLLEEHQIRLPLHDGAERIRYLVFAGRLSSPKGVPYLIKAFLGLEKEWREPLRLLLIGASGSGMDGELLYEQISGAGEHVLSLGKLPQEAVALLFQFSELFVLPSMFEGLPLVLLEALACGCPSLVSGLPTIRSWVPRDWLERGDVRFVDPMETAQADVPCVDDIPRFVLDLQEGMKDGLENLPSRQERRRLAAELKEHSWSAVFDRYREIYRDLSGEGP